MIASIIRWLAILFLCFLCFLILRIGGCMLNVKIPSISRTNAIENILKASEGTFYPSVYLNNDGFIELRSITVIVNNKRHDHKDVRFNIQDVIVKYRNGYIDITCLDNYCMTISQQSANGFSLTGSRNNAKRLKSLFTLE